MKINNKGFSAVEAIFGILIIGAIAGSAWFVIYRRQNNTASDISKQSSQSQQNDKAISGQVDLQSSIAELNATDIDGQLDTSEVNQSLAQ